MSLMGAVENFLTPHEAKVGSASAIDFSKAGIIGLVITGLTHLAQLIPMFQASIPIPPYVPGIIFAVLYILYAFGYGTKPVEPPDPTPPLPPAPTPGPTPVPGPTPASHA